MHFESLVTEGKLWKLDSRGFMVHNLWDPGGSIKFSLERKWNWRIMKSCALQKFNKFLFLPLQGSLKCRAQRLRILSANSISSSLPYLSNYWTLLEEGNIYNSVYSIDRRFFKRSREIPYVCPKSSLTAKFRFSSDYSIRLVVHQPSIPENDMKKLPFSVLFRWRLGKLPVVSLTFLSLFQTVFVVLFFCLSLLLILPSHKYHLLLLLLPLISRSTWRRWQAEHRQTREREERSKTVPGWVGVGIRRTVLQVLHPGGQV